MTPEHPLKPTSVRHADDRQLASLRQELHDRIDYLIDEIPAIQRQERDMGRGFPTGGAEGQSTISTRYVDSPVERLALNPSQDPALTAAEIITHFDEWNSHSQTLEREMRSQEPAKQIGRPNTIELCVECGLPAPKIKRLDGQPYHPGDCWWKAYNRTRGRRDAS